MNVDTGMASQSNCMADDLLIGAEAIAHYLGLGARTVYYLATSERLPTFNLGAKICLRKSTMAAWIAEQEQRTKGGAHLKCDRRGRL